MTSSKDDVLRKPAKTKAGVAPLAVMLPPRSCNHGACTYCPTLNAPQSYTPLSPAVMRARLLNYSPSKQVLARLKAFEMMNHPNDKVELIIMGGTFLQYPKEFKLRYVKDCFDSLNGKVSESLLEAQKLNESSKHRCVALCIETRPDDCSDEQILEMLSYGCTRVELGIQMPDDELYKLSNRGHGVKEVVDATRRLKDAGFKIGYHIMPGLPGSNVHRDLELFKEVFSSDDYKPDQIKLYPCQVIKGSALEKDYYDGKYVPYDEQTTKDILVEMIKLVPEYCRVMRVMREIPPAYLVAGLKRIDLRTEVEKELKKDLKNIFEIRMREVGFRNTDDFNTSIKVSEYPASNGKELFLQVVNSENVLFGLLRLRFPGSPSPLIPELNDCAIVREVHVYGKALRLGESNDDDNTAQHGGLGKELMKKAEELSKSNGFKKLAVISGVGVRPYYEKLGYELVGMYMVKVLQ